MASPSATFPPIAKMVPPLDATTPSPDRATGRLARVVQTTLLAVARPVKRPVGAAPAGALPLARSPTAEASAMISGVQNLVPRNQANGATFPPTIPTLPTLVVSEGHPRRGPAHRGYST